VTVDITPSQGWIWSSLCFLVACALWIVGDRRWALKPPKDRVYTVEPTQAEARAKRIEHEQETERLCDEFYVRRARYHEDMGVISAELGRFRIDMEKMNVSVAVISKTMEILAETSKEQGITLRAILMHTKELNRRDARFKPELDIPASEE
jgi:hypothetical protein